MNLDIAINEEEEAEAEAEEGSNNDIITTFGRDCMDVDYMNVVLLQQHQLVIAGRGRGRGRGLGRQDSRGSGRRSLNDTDSYHE
mmetsp:Transcript_38337/g.42981  ORF Transcript_38337/g.42981 Transcript_38337/m.42981 type:complete len:84 (-) Transcript_38337:588-839(-)